MKAKPTLAETYEEAERVEAEKKSIEDYPEQSGEKNVGRKALLFTKPKEEQSFLGFTFYPFGASILRNILLGFSL